MARARNIKPSFFANEIIGDSDPLIGLVFIGMWCLADREGRLEDRPKKIRAQLLPYRDGIDMEEIISFLANHEFILRYEHEGARFIQILKFHQHQAPHHLESPSVIPAPDGYENKLNNTPVGVPQRKRIYARDGHKCLVCGADDNLSIDHIIPVSKGGDSSDDNLRTLCKSCNSSKGNREKTKHEISSSSANDDQPRLYPSDSLIPDSLNLIPDSPIRIPDSLHSGAAAKVSAQKTAVVPVAIAPVQKQESEIQLQCRMVWRSYSEAYLNRYGVEPVRNAKVNSNVKQFVQRLGADDAPPVAGFFLSHNDAFYVRKGHDFGMLLADAEKIRMEWASQRTVTATQAAQADRTQANREAANQALEILEAGAA